MKHYPETIEHRWDILYRDYPEVYERFASYPYSPYLTDVVAQRFALAGKVVVDNGSGTGLSALALAGVARTVIGVEPEASMRGVAVQWAQKLGITNVDFVGGCGEWIPLRGGLADAVTSFTAGLQSISEAKRVVRRPGVIVAVDVAPGCYGGDLNEVLAHPIPPEVEGWSDLLVGTHGFSYDDVETVQEYGSTENIVSSYGFIFGRKAIDYLKQTGKTSITWTFRVHYLHLEA